MEQEKLKIGKKDYDVTRTELAQASLKFYPENPRVYSEMNSFGEEPTQDEIEDHMCKLEHVKQLKESIKSNGGLIDPLIVRDGDFTVLEGNSRLAAYRILASSDPIKWGKVKCLVLPADIDDGAIFALLGQYHIIGRKDWDPFEQANYLYRRHKETKYPIEYMAGELGINKGKASKMIDVIQKMIDNSDLNKHKWSYYEEYLKNAGIKKYRETNPDIDDVIAKQIKDGDIKDARDIRKLGDIAKVGDKQSKRLMKEIVEEKTTLYDAYEDMEDSGKFEDAVKKLKNFRTLINDDSFEKQLYASQEVLDQAKFNIDKIIKQLEHIQDRLKKDNE